MPIIFMAKQKGISLIELLLSISLALWLLSGILFIYLSNQKTYLFDQALTRIQENGRIAAQFLSRDIRMAGFIGCLPLNEFNLLSAADLNFSNNTRIVGWHDGNTTASYILPTSVLQNAVKGTDILLVQEATVNIQNVNSAKENTIYFSEKTKFAANDIFLIADCTHAELGKVATASGDSVQTVSSLQSNYTKSEASRFASIVYYIRKTDLKNKTGQPIYSLYRRDLNQSASTPQELVEGVENMQILFGVKRENQLQYLSAPELTQADWYAIRSVHIALLLNSLEAVNEQPMSYQFNHQKYTASDRILRREWDVTVALREPIE